MKVILMLNMLEHALKYASEGIKVFPLHSVENGVCSCNKPDCNGKTRGKHPRWIRGIFENGCSDATTEPDKLRDAWMQYPSSNIGVATGDGFFIVDIDNKDGFYNIKKYFGITNLKYTRSVKTGNGVQLWFHSDEPMASTVKTIAGLDTRGEGGYGIAPPSIHYTGRQYQWLSENSIQELPAAFKNYFSKQSFRENKEPITAESWLRNINKGERDDYITRLVGKMIQAQMPVSEVIRAAQNWNAEHCDIPLPEADIIRIVRSISGIDERKNLPPSRDTPYLKHFRNYKLEYSSREMNWLIKDWLPEATIAAMTGPPGSMKTWCLLDLIVSLTTGRKFLNRYKVERTSSVLFYQQEDAEEEILERLACIMQMKPWTYNEEKDEFDIQLMSKDPDIWFHTDREFHFKDKVALGRMRQAIKKLRPSVVVLDPLYTMVDVSDFMLHAAKDMDPLKQLRKEFGVTFIIAHHTSQSSGTKRIRDEMWGSQFLNAFIETGIHLRPGEEKGEITIHRHTKRRGEQPTLEFKFDIDQDKGIYEVDIYDPTNKLTELTQKVLHLIKTKEMTSLFHFEKELGIKNRRGIDNAIKELGAVKNSKKVFYIPDLIQDGKIEEEI